MINLNESIVENQEKIQEKKNFYNKIDTIVENFEDVVKENLELKLPNKDKKGCLSCAKFNSNILELKSGFSYFEADCKGLLGKHFCVLKSSDDVNINKDDQILVKSEDGSVDIARVIELGDYSKIKKLFKCSGNETLPEVIRKVNDEDLEQYRRNLNDEQKARPIFFRLIKKYNLDMKLVDIHYQFDRKKLFFFYTADGRVDFRELAKELAANFRTRIELRQIGVRDEAKKIGGIGTCGREFCCSSFLNTFKRITTQTVSEQNVSSNLTKLSGPCGKLKCCLSYEVDSEIEHDQLKLKIQVDDEDDN